MMRSWIRFVCGLTLIPLLAQPAISQTIKLGTLAPVGSPWHDALENIAAAWSNETDGQVNIRIFPSGIIGDEPDMVRKMRIGQLQAAALSGAGLARIDTAIQGLQMPMMFRTDAELNYVRDKLSPKLEARLASKGFRLLAWGDGGWVHFFSRAPVSHPDDLRPQKIWVWAGDTALVEAWKDAGYKPVPLPATEMLTALQSGLVDALPTTPVAALSFQLFGIANHMADIRWAPLVGGIVISERAWSSLPENQRPRLQEIAREEGGRLNDQLPAFMSEATEIMVVHGLKVHPVSDAEAQEWEARARASYPKIIGTLVPADIAAEVERLRDEFRRQPAHD